MIRVWSDSESAGVLNRMQPRGSTFAYDPRAAVERAISVTMPVRTASWDAGFGLLPIFEMNLPEGALRERLIRRFAKATGSFDDLDLLAIVGRSQIGRLRYSGLDEDINEDVPFQSIDDILRARRDGELFAYLLESYATHSGLSGVQPKVMIRARGDKISDPKVRHSSSIMSATHIVKMWDEDEYPELAANEYFCLNVARKLGLEVPDFQLSDDGGAIVIERFDRNDDAYLGFEDFCVLNALGTADKYKGGYEARLFRRLREFLAPTDTPAAMDKLFRLFALNCAIRNGDAHLKNFGITYGDVQGDLRLAPVYDLVTTWAYIPNDPMALTLDGSTRWPDRARLIELARVRCEIMPRKAEEVIEAIADALATVAPEAERYFMDREHEVGQRMLAAWSAGIKDSLGLVRGLVPVARPAHQGRKLARSDGMILEHLRQNNGRVTGSIRALASRLDLPPSTLNASIKRLSERGLVLRYGQSISLAAREV